MGQGAYIVRELRKLRERTIYAMGDSEAAIPLDEYLSTTDGQVAVANKVAYFSGAINVTDDGGFAGDTSVSIGGLPKPLEDQSLTMWMYASDNSRVPLAAELSISGETTGGVTFYRSDGENIAPLDEIRLGGSYPTA